MLHLLDWNSHLSPCPYVISVMRVILACTTEGKGDVQYTESCKYPAVPSKQWGEALLTFTEPSPLKQNHWLLHTAIQLSFSLSLDKKYFSALQNKFRNIKILQLSIVYGLNNFNKYSIVGTSLNLFTITSGDSLKMLFSEEF
jgi:hypothetical protein